MGVERQQLPYGIWPFDFNAAYSVCCSKTATVIGPTPPGTGVIQADFWLATSNSTSPSIVPSGNNTVPRSMTIAFCFTHSPLISFSLPTAVTKISA